MNWQCPGDADAVAAAVVAHIEAAAKEAVARRGRFSLVLAGGTTPLKAYHLLSQMSAGADNWHIFYGDERCLPADHAERNSRAAAEAWLDGGRIPKANIHIIPAERGADAAAQQYTQILEGWLPFDLVLLGMGEDGHVASLFPGQVHDPKAPVVAVHDAPKPPPDRVSLNLPVLAGARACLVVITGAAKRTAVEAWQVRHADLPVARLAKAADHLSVLVDKEACHAPMRPPV
ncbi:MAG: 6-phosphogluconolactonase [Pseudomonadota bacterium]